MAKSERKDLAFQKGASESWSNFCKTVAHKFRRGAKLCPRVPMRGGANFECTQFSELHCSIPAVNNDHSLIGLFLKVGLLLITLLASASSGFVMKIECK